MNRAAAIALYRAFVTAGESRTHAWARVLLVLLDRAKTEPARRVAVDWMDTDPWTIDP